MALPFLARGLGEPGVKLKRRKAVPEGKAVASSGGMLGEDLPNWTSLLQPEYPVLQQSWLPSC